jgi:hypothetical protein
VLELDQEQEVPPFLFLLKVACVTCDLARTRTKTKTKQRGFAFTSSFLHLLPPHAALCYRYVVLPTSLRYMRHATRNRNEGATASLGSGPPSSKSQAQDTSSPHCHLQCLLKYWKHLRWRRARVLSCCAIANSAAKNNNSSPSVRT